MKNWQNMLRVALVSALMCGCGTAVLAQEEAAPPEKPAKISAKTYDLLNLFGDVFERVRDNYVEEVPDKKLIETALNGMLMALDPHSGYLDESSFADMQVQTKGEFGGLGIEVTMDNGLVKVVSPIDDTPAAKAGLKPGDLVIKIDNEDVMGMSLNDAVDKMRGKVGSNVTLAIVRPDKAEPFEVKLARAVIKVRSIRSRLIGDDVGYIRITSFNEQVESGLASAIKDLEKQAADKHKKTQEEAKKEAAKEEKKKDKAEDGKDKKDEKIVNDVDNGRLKGFVLDLRNNPGGLLDQAIYVSDSFLEKGEIVSTRGRRAEETKRVNATPGDLIDGMPLVVLINEGSASASEIVAGALQDHRRAVLMGMKSFGKGSVQTLISLPGYGAMRLTTARYYTPSGRSIQAEGIVPDIEVKQAKIEEIEDKYAKFMPKESELRGALKNDTKVEVNVSIDTNKDDKKKDPAQTKADIDAEGDAKDYQLQRAADLIRGVSRYMTKVTTQ